MCGSPMDLYTLAVRYVRAIVDLLNQHAPIDKIVLTAYNREEYNEFHKVLGDLSCNDYQRLLKIVAAFLMGLKLHDRVIFQEIESSEYYLWLVEKKQPYF